MRRWKLSANEFENLSLTEAEKMFLDSKSERSHWRIQGATGHAPQAQEGVPSCLLPPPKKNSKKTFIFFNVNLVHRKKIVG